MASGGTLRNLQSVDLGPICITFQTCRGVPAKLIHMTELDERVARIRDMCSRQLGDSAFLAHNILRTLDGLEPDDQGEKSNTDDDDCSDGLHEPYESTFLEKVAGRTLATVGVLCLVALMIGGTLALLRWWL